MDFKKRFYMDKPVIGMIHLAGENPVDRALKEMEIYSEEGIEGVIIEDFHGTPQNVRDTLKFLRRERKDFRLKIGVNLLSNPYEGFELAEKYGDFVQFDSVHPQHLDLRKYMKVRAFSKIVVLGGVRFKYQLSTGNSLEQDIEDAKSLCDAIVTTGEGTGIETPLDKLRDFRKVMGDCPLIVGAGVNSDNVYEQLMIADGVIVGSAFKPNGDTEEIVQRDLVKRVMDVVEGIRYDLQQQYL